MNIYQNLNFFNEVHRRATGFAKLGLETIRDFIESDHLAYTLMEKVEKLGDVVDGGGASGSISSLTYYEETIAFTMIYMPEIEELLEDEGLTLKDFFEEGDDLTHFLNRLAWWAYELEAAKLLNELKKELEKLEEKREETAKDLKKDFLTSVGALPWDYRYKHYLGLNVQLITTPQRFLEAQGDTNKELEELAREYGLYIEVCDNGKEYGFEGHDIYFKDGNDSVVFAHRACFNCWGDFTKFKTGFTKEADLTEEEAECLSNFYYYFEAVFYETLKRWDENFNTLFEDTPELYYLDK